jgi:hypothetical protein
MEYPTLKECKRYNAKILPKFCENCQAIAQQVFLLLVAFPENKVKISDIANTDIDRFVTCGDCPDNPLPLPVDLIEKKVRNALRLSLKQIISKGHKEDEEDDIQKIAQRIF